MKNSIAKLALTGLSLVPLLALVSFAQGGGPEVDPGGNQQECPDVPTPPNSTGCNQGGATCGDADVTISEAIPKIGQEPPCPNETEEVIVTIKMTCIKDGVRNICTRSFKTCPRQADEFTVTCGGNSYGFSPATGSNATWGGFLTGASSCSDIDVGCN